MMSEDIYKYGPAPSMRCLKERILKAWENIDIEKLENLIKSMPTRMKLVVHKKDDKISY